MVKYCKRMMDSLDSLKALIDPKLYKILQSFRDNPGKLYHLNSIAQETKVPLATTFRLVRKLVKADWITIVQVGKMKLYTLKEKKK